MRRQRPGSAGFAGFGVDRPDTAPFVQTAGKLIVNCGAIEMLSLLYIRELSDDPVVFELAIDFPLSRRITLVMDLAKRKGLPSRLLKRLRKAWQEVRGISEVRNLVAHSPVSYGWKGDERPGSPDYLGIPVLRDLKRTAGAKMRIQSIEPIKQAVDDAAREARVLDELLVEAIAAIESQAGTHDGAT